MHTHLEQWAVDTAAPGEQLGVQYLTRGSHLSRGQFLPEPRCEPTTSGYKFDALSIRATTATTEIIPDCLYQIIIPDCSHSIVSNKSSKILSTLFLLKKKILCYGQRTSGDRCLWFHSLVQIQLLQYSTVKTAIKIQKNVSKKKKQTSLLFISLIFFYSFLTYSHAPVQWNKEAVLKILTRHVCFYNCCTFLLMSTYFYIWYWQCNLTLLLSWPLKD